MNAPTDLLHTGEDTPATRLASLMSDLSEDCWCAGWLSGTEFALWELANAGGGLWGMGVVTATDAARLLCASGCRCRCPRICALGT